MPDIKISQLSDLTFLDSTDVIVVNDASSGTTKKAVLSTLLDLVSARLVRDSADGIVVDGDLTVENEITLGGDLTTETGTIGFGALKDLTEDITIFKFVDQLDGIANNNDDTSIPTSAAVKAYADVSGGGFATSGTLLTDSAGDSDRLMFPVMVSNIGSTDSAQVDSDFAWNPATQTMTIRGNIVPATDSAYDLGDSVSKWKDLYLSGSTINLGGKTLSVDNANLVIGNADAVVATAFVGDGSGLTGISVQETPRIVKLTPDTSQVIRYDSDGVTENDTLTFSVTSENFSGAQTFTYSVDGVDKVINTTSTSFTLPDADEPAFDTNILIKVDAKEDGVSKASDFVSVYGIKAGVDGKDTVVGFLTNEVHAEAADSTGQLTGNLNDAGGFFKVFVGLTDVTGDASLTYSVGTTPGINNVVLAQSGEYSIGGFDTLATQNGAANFSVAVPNTLIPGYSGSDVTIDKQYSIVKQIGGSGQDGDPGVDGTDARAVKLVPLNGQVIRYDSANQEFDTLQFEALPEGTSGTVTYEFEIKNATEGTAAYNLTSRGANQPLQSGSATTFTLPDGQEPDFVNATYGEAPVRTLRCQMLEDGVVVAQDVVSLYALKQGFGVTGFLTNGQHVEPADSAGAPITSLDDGDGIFKVFIGTREVQTDPAVTFSTVSNTGINVTILDNGNYSLDGFTANDLTVLNGRAEFQANIPASFFPQGESPVTIDQVYSVAKSIRGPKGTAGEGQGTPGLNARSVILSPDNGQVVRYDDAGNEDPAVVISFTATPENAEAAVTYRFSTKLIGTDPDFVVAQNTGTSNLFTLNGQTNRVKPQPGQQVVVKVEMFEDGQVGNQPTDIVTIYGLQDGTTITGFLTNEAHIEPFNDANTAPRDGNYNTAGGTFKIFRGVSEITSSCTFTVQSNTGVDMDIVAGTGVYTVGSGGLTANIGTATFQASIPANLIPGASSPLLYDKIYSITKSLNGEDGQPGNGVTSDLTNDTHSMPATFAGAPTETKITSTIGGNTFYPGATTRFTVFENGADVTSLYTISRAKSPNTTDFQYNISTDGRTIEVYNIANSVENATVTFTASGRSGFDPISRTFSLTKVNAGSPGSDATVYRLRLGTYTIKVDGSTFTPSVFTATQRKITGSSAAVDTTDGTIEIFRNGGASAVATEAGATISYTIPASTTELRVKLTVGGDIVEDEIIPVLSSGGGRGPGRWHIDVDTVNYSSGTDGRLPATSADAQFAWDNGVFVGTNPGEEVSGDQAWFFKGTIGNPSAQSVWIYNGTGWDEQSEVIDGNLLVNGTVTADQVNVVGTGTSKTIIKSDVIGIYDTDALRVKIGNLSADPEA